MSLVNIDVSHMTEFFTRMKSAAQGDFKNDLQQFLEGIGNTFIDIITNEIERLEVVDERLLINSFDKIDNGVWETSDGILRIEIGTYVNYAKFVNDGHWLNPQGVERRFVPGDVKLDSDGKIIEFHYNPNAKTGMMLKQKWVNGKFYYESALKILDKIFPEAAEKMLQAWINNYFTM